MQFLYFYYVTRSCPDCFSSWGLYILFLSFFLFFFFIVLVSGQKHPAQSEGKKNFFFPSFFHLVMIRFFHYASLFSVTKLTIQTIPPSDKSFASYYVWNLVSNFVTVLSCKHRSVNPDGTDGPCFCALLLSDATNDVALILHSRPKTAEGMKDVLKNINSKRISLENSYYIIGSKVYEYLIL